MLLPTGSTCLVVFTILLLCTNIKSSAGSGSACDVGPWQEPSECSAQCGPGYKTIERQYLNQDWAERLGCETELERIVSCSGDCGGQFI